jgi:hypothetical protein
VIKFLKTSLILVSGFSLNKKRIAVATNETLCKNLEKKIPAIHRIRIAVKVFFI